MSGIHVNEMNTVPPPWPYRKTILEQQALLPQILTVIEDFLEETDVDWYIGRRCWIPVWMHWG